MGERTPRDRVIRQHVELATRHAVPFQTYAQSVAELYLDRTREHERSVPFRAAVGDPYAAMRHNARIVRRFLGMDEAEVRMPVDAEEAFVLALPQPFQRECLRELAHRFGLMATPEVAGNCRVSALRAPADLLRETGEAMAAIAPMLDDGLIGPNDAPLAGRAIAELRDVQTAAQSLIERIAHCTEAGHHREAKS